MKTVYIVMVNSDFTEGRGPMRLHSVWDDGEEAIKYVSEQDGIYGSKQRVERNKYGFFAYANGYEIQEHVVNSSYEGMLLAEEQLKKQQKDAEEARIREKALKKLTAEEKNLLGLG